MIAYFILVHRYAKQFQRLFTAIYDPNNWYVIHIDKRSHPSVREEIEEFLLGFDHVAIIVSKNALWGGYSLVDAQLRGMEKLLEMNADWEFFINLSGQDFPLKSQPYIKKFLQKNKGKNFLNIYNQREVRPKTISRFENYTIELKQTIIRTSWKRPFLAGAIPYIGNQWMMLSRDFCAFLQHSSEVDRFKKFYKHTFIADESFFQTVIMNTSYKAKIVPDDMRDIDWVPEGIIKLRPRTFTMKDASRLTKSPQLFARKFDTNVDSDILSFLEKHIANN